METLDLHSNCKDSLHGDISVLGSLEHVKYADT